MNSATHNVPAHPGLARFTLYVKALAWTRQILRLPIRGCLRDQLHRAVVSVVLNIAEGGGQTSRGAKTRHYQIAWASLYEVSAVLDLMAAGISTEPLPEELISGLREIDAMLYAIIR